MDVDSCMASNILGWSLGFFQKWQLGMELHNFNVANLWEFVVDMSEDGIKPIKKTYGKFIPAIRNAQHPYCLSHSRIRAGPTLK